MLSNDINSHAFKRLSLWVVKVNCERFAARAIPLEDRCLIKADSLHVADDKKGDSENISPSSENGASCCFQGESFCELFVVVGRGYS